MSENNVTPCSPKRPSWDEYFMEVAHVVRKRSTCLRRQVGAVLVRDKRILATGYNGAPSGLPHCAESGCLRSEMNVPSGERHEICRGTHAEQNAIAQAAFLGVGTRDSTMYVTAHPCSLCTKIMINAGVIHIVYDGEYPDTLSQRLLAQSRIKVERFSNHDNSNERKES
ncbi:MAG TPA: cytidine/deoxycytidylate deaminase family protein [Candidatus Sumerlaeota bacterium]|nr:cytidine/deoxycytidylate deaminase family protein [Candidatus Sumerlaeota bacterium]